MSGQGILIWIFVGLVSGWLASAVVGGGYGLVGDIIIGIVGAFIGGPVLRALGLHVPLHGLPGMIGVALIGALVLLLALRIVRRLLGTG